MAEGAYVSYLRVSTDKQGKSGLGIEAQRAAVTAYLNGGNWTLIGEHVEIETGKKSDRPELTRALALCRRRGATLVIARLDRLARNVRFISTLMEEGVPFVAVDMPNATPFMLHVYAAMAEEEARAISRRTKVALAAAQARGVRLGGARPGCGDRIRAAVPAAAAARREQADDRAQSLASVIADLRAAGITSLRGIAKELSARGEPTARGGAWTATQVGRLLHRLDSVPANATA